MLPAFIPVEHYQTKFYQKERNFKGFINLSDESIDEIGKKIYKKQSMCSDSSTYSTERISKLTVYQKTLQYLTSQFVHLELKSFDEQLAYLIMTVDPNLVTFKEYLKRNIMSIKDISKVEDDKQRDLLMKKRKDTIADYETSVREKIGFYDPRLLKYEEIFFYKFFGDKELITEVKANTQEHLVFMSKLLRDFDNISDERYDELVEISKVWLSLVPDKFNSSVAAYSVTNQKKLLGIRSLSEQLALFILLIDSNLDMLKIYEEESRMSIVEERIMEEFGYYNPELLTLEKKFHKRFCPEKEISVWSMTKKNN